MNRTTMSLLLAAFLAAPLSFSHAGDRAESGKARQESEQDSKGESKKQAKKESKKESKKDAKQAKAGARKIPQFSLKDPAGKTHSSGQLVENGAVIVVTAPILSNKDAQEGWSEHLTGSKGSNKASLVFLEDMEPSNFKGKALKEMKKEYRPGEPPILLIDDSGSVRRRFGVPEKKTVVLVYNSDGQLVHRVDQKPNAKAARQIWQKAGGK